MEKYLMYIKVQKYIKIRKYIKIEKNHLHNLLMKIL